MSEIMERFLRRADGIRDWLKEHHPTIQDEQLHVQEGTIERAYWHYGYMIALRDALRALGEPLPVNASNTGTDFSPGQGTEFGNADTRG